jgi:hypothetical protein
MMELLCSRAVELLKNISFVQKKAPLWTRTQKGRSIRLRASLSFPFLSLSLSPRVVSRKKKKKTTVCLSLLGLENRKE